MPRTCLIPCGMTKPTTTASGIVDKGLASCFLWIFPEQVYKAFGALEISANQELKETPENFTNNLGN